MAALCLLSGGLDSSAALALWAGEVRLALTIDYGQRAANAEFRAARAVSAAFGVVHETLRLEVYTEGGGALLEADREVPRPSARQIETSDPALELSAQAVWVPNRNGLLLQVAAARAEATGLDVVLVGFNREEALTFPDNSAAFLEATNRALEFSTQGRVRVEAPTLHMEKREILAAAEAAGVPLGSLWVCYLGGDRPCGTCESCRRFERANRDWGFDLRFDR